eukprot:TRINITY_DN39932_c0_g1_i1.p1 TRINITY_DN39932_c0_g1~~TRINITY_DN39932_c0_g1_i1.p1  ORF type:complete len:245 (-),score=50.49 TRINITY_DN39932_c0_g1_i1:206-940(-)
MCIRDRYQRRVRGTVKANMIAHGNLLALAVEPAFLWFGLDFGKFVASQFKQAPDQANLRNTSIQFQVVAYGNFFHFGVMMIMFPHTIIETVHFPLRTSLAVHAVALLCAASAKWLRDSAGAQIKKTRGEDRLYHAFAPKACDVATQGVLVTEGVFGWVRHPIYLSYVLANLGTVLRMLLHVFFGPMVWYKTIIWLGAFGHVLFFTAFIFASSLNEEVALMASKSAEQYKKYKASVKSRILPGLF